MEYGPPPLFNQGVSARARLGFFSLLAIVLIVIDARVNALDVVRNGVEILLTPFERALVLPRDLAEGAADYTTSLSSLRAENAQLRHDAGELAEAVRRNAQLQAENDQLRALSGLRSRIPVPSQVAAVLYESRDPFSRKIVIDHGSHDGIRAGGPVLDETGVVGQVTRVFPFGAEVTLLTDKEQSIPVQVVRNGIRGIAFGGIESDSMEIRYLPVSVDVQPGDEIVASGLDGLYPVGAAVATVVRVDRDPKEQFAHIVLHPLAGHSRARMLLVMLAEPPPLLPGAGETKAAAPAKAESSTRRAARR